MDTGYAAFGRRVPEDRLSAGLAALREMVPGISTEQAMSVVGRMAEQIERDEPYKAEKVAREVLDVTGMYRLLATLLAG